MSFGCSIGDFITLTQIAYSTFQNARKACGAFDNLTREVESLHTVLNRLQLEVSKPDSLLNRKEDNRKKELSTLARNCRRVLRNLSQILEKYNALSDEKKSVTKLWQRVKFGNGEMQDLEKIRGEIAIHTQAITLFVNMLAIGSQGKVEAYMDTHGEELRSIKRSLNWVTASLQATGSHGENSILTTYTEDDKLVWKTFRRELIKEGFSSQLLSRYKKVIKKYVIELGNRGLLDEVVNSEETVEVSIQDQQQAGIGDESPDLFAPGPSTPSKLSIVLQDTTSDVASDEKNNLGKEIEGDAKLLVETSTSSEAQINLDEHKSQENQESSGEPGPYFNEFVKVQDEICLQDEDSFPAFEKIDGSAPYTEEESEDDASSHLSSSESDLESLPETVRASEETVLDDFTSSDLPPPAIRPSDEEKSTISLKIYCNPSVEDLEDEDFLPGAHPNCSNEDIRDLLSFLLGQSFQVRYGRFKEDQHTRISIMSQEENLYYEEIKEEEMMVFAMTALGKNIPKLQIETKRHRIPPAELIIKNSSMRRAAMEVFLFFERKRFHASTTSFNGLGKPYERDEGRAKSLCALAQIASVTLDMAEMLWATTESECAELLRKQP